MTSELRFDISFTDDSTETISMGPYETDSEVLSAFKANLQMINAGWLDGQKISTEFYSLVKNENGATLKTENWVSNAHVITTQRNILF